MIKRIHRWGEKLDELHNQMDDYMPTIVDVKFLNMFHADRKLADIQNMLHSIKESL